ncbi:FtsX-like permease family protein [Candidatus Babeliales bacterium]|nr:FtsX-like permease family protein [Candidatus Babeliales bacterium]
MKISVARFLAWRYIIGTQDNSQIKSISKVCFFSIFISTLCLTLQIFIMTGFEQVISEKMQNIYPQLVMYAPEESSFDYATLKPLLLKNYSDKIAYLAPAHIKRVILQTKDTPATSAISLKAISAEDESNISSLEKKLIPEKKLPSVIHDNQIIIGKKIAEFHNLHEGDSAELLYTSDDVNNLKKASFESTPVIIGAIMDTGIMHYDTYVIIASLPFVQQTLHDENITQIGIKLKPGIDDTIFMNELEKKFHIDVHSWKTLYPALVAAQKLEKYVMFFLLALITLIACTTIISLLFMQIIRKKTDIALLKMMGMKNSEIILIFIFMGMILAIIAGIAGIIGAIGIGLLLQKYPFITLPDAYYCSHLPVSITWQICFLVFITVLFLSILSAWFSARSAQSINITQTLRFDS